MNTDKLNRLLDGTIGGQTGLPLVTFWKYHLDGDSGPLNRLDGELRRLREMGCQVRIHLLDRADHGESWSILHNSPTLIADAVQWALERCPWGATITLADGSVFDGEMRHRRASSYLLNDPRYWMDGNTINAWVAACRDLLRIIGMHPNLIGVVFWGGEFAAFRQFFPMINRGDRELTPDYSNFVVAMSEILGVIRTNTDAPVAHGLQNAIMRGYLPPNGEGLAGPNDMAYRAPLNDFGELLVNYWVDHLYMHRSGDDRAMDQDKWEDWMNGYDDTIVTSDKHSPTVLEEFGCYHHDGGTVAKFADGHSRFWRSVIDRLIADAITRKIYFWATYNPLVDNRHWGEAEFQQWLDKFSERTLGPNPDCIYTADAAEIVTDYNRLIREKAKATTV